MASEVNGCMDDVTTLSLTAELDIDLAVESEAEDNEVAPMECATLELRVTNVDMRDSDVRVVVLLETTSAA